MPRFFIRTLAFLLLASALPARAADGPPTDTPPMGALPPVADAAPDAYAPPLPYGGPKRFSVYVPMRDGVRLAVDVWLPEGAPAGARFPTILQQTRYWRRPGIRFPVNLFVSPLDHQGILGQFRRRFTARGYAWVDVDVRGSGASFGNRPWDYAPDEIRDGGDIMSWIARQGWSDGQVVTAGASYSGSTAEFAMINRHPAHRGVVTVSSEFDQYADILAPGGVPLTWWFDDWGALTSTLDRGEIPHADFWTRLASGGVAPVDGDRLGLTLGRAQAEHADNYDFRELRGLVFRDDFPLATAALSAGRAAARARQFDWLRAKFGPDFLARGTDLASTHAYLRDLRASGVPVLTVAGWLDGTYANAAAKRFNTVRNPASRLLIGPWDHTQRNISPFTAGGRTRFDLIAEIMRFTDTVTGLAPEAGRGRPAVRYYTLGAEQWREAASWPPAAARRRFWLATGQALAEAPGAGSVAFVPDLGAGSGRQTRFDTLAAVPLRAPYADRAARDRKLLVFDSAPLPAALEVTGHPAVTLSLAGDGSDGAVFVYLEHVGPEGRVTYMTEGMLRLLHRRAAAGGAVWEAAPAPLFTRTAAAPPLREAEAVRIELLPLSHLVPAGHRLRIAIGGADADHFARVPAAPAAAPHLVLGLAQSVLDLPAVAR